MSTSIPSSALVRRVRAAIAVLPAAAFFTAAPLGAQTTFYWDLDTATGSGSTSTTANGTCDTTTTNWTTSTGLTGDLSDTSASTWLNSAATPNNAVFSAAADITGASTITLSSAVNASNLVFEEGTVTIAGGTLTLGSSTSATSPSVSVASGLTATIASVVAGDDGLTKTGTGTLTLSGANTYTGETTINAGTLALGAANRIADTSTLNVSVGATFDLGSFSETVGAINDTYGSSGGTIKLGSGTLTFGGADSSYFATAISGSGGITKIGNTNAVLVGMNTYTGPTIISAGSLTFANAAPGSTPDTSAVSVAAGATLNFLYSGAKIGSLAGAGTVWLSDACDNLILGGNNSSTTFSGVIQADAPYLPNTGFYLIRGDTSGGITKIGTGTLTLSGASTYTGATTISAGTLALGAANRIADTSSLIVGSGTTFNLAGFAETVGALSGGGNITLGNATLTFGGRNSSDTFSGVVSGTGGLTKTGTGAQILSGANTYSGTTTISGGGSVQFASAANLGTGSISLSDGKLIWASGNTADVSSRFAALGASGATFDTNGNDIAFASALSGTGRLVKIGAGVLSLTANNTYSGGTAVTGGTLGFSRLASLGTGNVTLDDSTLRWNTGNTADVSARLATIGAYGATFDTNGNNVTFATGLSSDSKTSAPSGIVINGGLTKTGTGTLTLSGVNTYIGTTTISAGTLSLGAANRIADASPVSVASGATFNLAGFAETVGALSGAGNVTLGAGTLTFGGRNSSDTFSGVVTGTGGLTKTGTGTQTLSGANTYSGATTISGGSILFSTSASLGTGSLTLNGGGLVWGTGNTLDVSSRLAALGANGATFDTNGNNVAITSVLSGTGRLTKVGSGVLNLGGTNTYSGGTAITGGAVSFSTLANLGATGANVTLDGGSLRWNTSSTVDVSSRLAALGASGATFDTNGNNVAFATALSGSGGLAKTGSGTLTFSGANTYTGNTTVTAGILALGAANRIADASALSVASGATFNLANFAETVGALSGGGNITLGNATLTFGGKNTSDAFSGVISGTGSLAKTGTGTATLSGVNTYTGGTTVTGGSILFSTSANLGTGNITLNGGGLTWGPSNTADISSRLNALGASGATFDTNGNNVSFATALSGTWFTKAGAGTLTLNAANTYTGRTSISGGTLALGASNRIPDAQLFISEGATLNLAGFSESIAADISIYGNINLGSGTFAGGGFNDSSVGGVISGTGGFTKIGTGTLDFTGANTYTGATTISAGTLNLQAPNTTSSASAVNIASGATLAVYYENTVAALTGSGNLELTGSFFTPGGVLTFGANNMSNTFSGSATGVGGLIKTGTGTQTLTGNNTFTGQTIINGGTVVLAGGTSLYGDSFVNNGSTLRVTAANATASGETSSLTLAPGTSFILENVPTSLATLSAPAASGSTPAATVLLNGTAAALTLTGTRSIAAVISGAGSLKIVGYGNGRSDYTLQGANTYTGRTSVTQGNLQISSDSNLGAAPVSLVANQLTLDGGTLIFNSATPFATTANRGISLGASGGGFTNIGAGDAQVTGIVSGIAALDLTITGTGRLSLTGVNTYTGGTSFNGSGGLVDFTAWSNFGSGNLNFVNGGLRWTPGNTLDLTTSGRVGTVTTAILSAGGNT
ncbi:MAG: autotransporter-associated beta strand repeat-containing protein, partial [Akkermansiaceae bacterium]|nr:autotransporter-associated beta strand repeat-containing protein [Akkermansiaceae bacterium]